MDTLTESGRSRWKMSAGLGFCLFAAIALFFLWEEHRAHILGALPFLLLLSCPIIHLFMHGRHGGHHGHSHDDRSSTPRATGGGLR